METEPRLGESGSIAGSEVILDKMADVRSPPNKAVGGRLWVRFREGDGAAEGGEADDMNAATRAKGRPRRTNVP